ncbi:MAG: ribosome biogenesis GTPase YlqF [Ruminococcaceae bacterium]|nr:ribosome biogenesis GTPase YlqF [Oscillospiraceae bacterium]
MPSQTIQWFPGHMAKTRRLISENLKNVDAVLILLDARIPYSSQNPEIIRLCAGKPSIILLNKASLADPAVTRAYAEHYTNENTVCIETDCISGHGLSKIAPAIRQLCGEKLARYEEKGMVGRSLKAMVVGIPNVGKSSLINKISGNKKAKVENRPGVTLNKQWVGTDIGIMLLDMPGVLWPKFEEAAVGENLAITGAIKDDVLDVESIAMILCGRLRKYYPELLCARYKIDKLPTPDEADDYDLLMLIGKKRGFCISGGEIDTERTANMLLDEFRAGKIGRISLDIPDFER